MTTQPMHRPALLTAIAFAIALLTTPSAVAQTPAPQPGAESDYVIGPEDVLDIAVWGNTDVSRTMPVRPDGKVSLPLLDDIQAAGLTPMQLRATLAAALERYIASPMVSVIVREVHSFKVTVIGEVKTPGRYELHSRTTVLDVLALAGGLSQYAVRNRITILRRQGDAVRELAYDFDRILKTGSKNAGQDNLCVQPGDIIVVP